MVQCGVFKVYSDANMPILATTGSACFDLCAYLKKGVKVSYYDNQNIKHTQILHDESIDLMTGYRYLIPSGLIFDIPKGHSIRLHPRSGLSLKKGVNLANCEAVIDFDYTLETFILLTNKSYEVVTIGHGERVCQLEVVKSLEYQFVQTENDIETKTDRVGGLGHTGTSITLPCGQGTWC